ncbi:MAG TPA: F0F1 ATP synthase subunit A [Actinomycetota bacterium]|nr:F0F1 ATP synthase subunit A [Actinomycetota bacterium]
MSNLGTVGAIIAAEFHPPTTKDFVWPCWGPELHVGGLSFCYNFIFFLLTLAFAATILFFYIGLRRPKLVPGKFQALVESAIEFVRNQIQMQMIGPEGARFLPLLMALFFFIFFGNILEVTPGVMFPLHSRIAFPIVMALIAWVVYNYVGIRKHGFIGYAKMVMFPPGAPLWLYPLLVPIEFFTTIIIRPITLSVRLFANMVAGHFLLAVFFLGSLALITGFPYILGVVSFGMGVALVGFEIFVSGLQAFIFAVLTASYIGGALAEEH